MGKRFTKKMLALMIALMMVLTFVPAGVVGAEADAGYPVAEEYQTGQEPSGDYDYYGSDSGYADYEVDYDYDGYYDENEQDGEPSPGLSGYEGIMPLNTYTAGPGLTWDGLRDLIADPNGPNVIILPYDIIATSSTSNVSRHVTITGDATITVDFANEARHFWVTTNGLLTLEGNITLTRSATMIAEERLGGGVAVNHGGHFIMNGGTITNILQGNGAAIHIGSSESGTSIVEVNGGVISNNRAIGMGGGISLGVGGQRGRLYVRGGEFLNNYAELGSAIAVSNNPNNADPRHFFLGGNAVFRGNLEGNADGTAFNTLAVRAENRHTITSVLDLTNVVRDPDLIVNAAFLDDGETAHQERIWPCGNTMYFTATPGFGFGLGTLISGDIQGTIQIGLHQPTQGGEIITHGPSGIALTMPAGMWELEIDYDGPLRFTPEDDSTLILPSGYPITIPGNSTVASPGSNGQGSVDVILPSPHGDATVPEGSMIFHSPDEQETRTFELPAPIGNVDVPGDRILFWIPPGRYIVRDEDGYIVDMYPRNPDRTYYDEAGNPWIENPNHPPGWPPYIGPMTPCNNHDGALRCPDNGIYIPNPNYPGENERPWLGPMTPCNDYDHALRCPDDNIYIPCPDNPGQWIGPMTPTPNCPDGSLTCPDGDEFIPNPDYPGEGERPWIQRPDFMWGDVNGDGRVDFEDIELLEMYLAGFIGPNDLDLRAARVTGNATVTFADIELILMYIAGFISTLAPQ